MDTKNNNNKNKQYLSAVVADIDGNIFDMDGYAAVGMSGETLTPLTIENTEDMPFGGELMYLPDRAPVLYNIYSDAIETLYENPYSPGEALYPVAAFNSPGYVNAYVSAYEETIEADYLPLFSYGAVGWHQNGFRTSVVRVDKERRQDLRLMSRDKIISGIKKIQKKMPKNRLRQHLEKCAMDYGCPAAKNFFLGRYEAPLPTSGKCNAQCHGCISLQKNNGITSPQDRIAFTPSPDEISEVAVRHINQVKKSVVSFGQGCEGDPLFAFDVIEPAIKKIRAMTSEGTINMNTNGSKPELLDKLFDAGLDSIRISMNSARRDCYAAYFRPVNYDFSDVERGIELAIKKGKFVSVNYLNCPGFTDSPEEMNALISFLTKYPINHIQWRNLNFDPLRYYSIMGQTAKNGQPFGMKATIHKIHNDFPNISCGYFNPPKETFK